MASQIPICYQPVHNLPPLEYYGSDYHELQSISSQRPLFYDDAVSSKHTSRQHDRTSKSSKPQQARERASAWQRFSPLLAAACAAALSTVPGVFYWQDRSFGVRTFLYDATLNHRQYVQVAVAILASIFAYLWTYALCMSFNLIMRNHMSGKQYKMDIVRLYASVSRQALDINLSWKLMALSATFVGVLYIQSWLWQGALTPDFTNVSELSSIPIVKTGQGSFDFGNFTHIPADGGIYVNCSRITQTNGTFTNCPGRELAGPMIDAITNAGDLGGVPRNHSKPDNSGYRYIGRSYGVGAAVGLMDLPDLGNIQGYKYSELGYETSAQCLYNSSSNYTLESSFTDNDGGTPNLYLVNGNRPNDPPGDRIAGGNGYVLPSFGRNADTIIAMTAGSCCGSRIGQAPFYVSIAAGPFYNFLDKIECQIFFEPTMFDITVSVDNHTIAVSSQPPNNTAALAIADPEPRGALREWTLRGLQSLTMVQTTLYISTPGEAFISTVVNQMHNKSFDPRGGAVPEVLPAINSSMEAALDTILLNLGGFALAQPGGEGADTTTADFQVRAVQIGSEGFIIAVLVTNVLVFLATVFMSTTTMFFSDSPAFDFSDMGAMMAGIVMGRELGFGEAGGMDGAKLAGWRGDSRDQKVGNMRLVVDCKLGTPVAPFVKLE